MLKLFGATRIASLFAVLSDPTRLQVVYALLRAESGELCVGDIAISLGRDDTTISHQLRVLRNQQIVAIRKVGRIVYYRLVDEHIPMLFELGMTHINETSTSSKEADALAWAMIIEASIAITTGFATHSVSLEGFGIDSIIELVAGSILVWRLLVEMRGDSIEVVSHAERRASWITGISLFGLALCIVADSAFAFLTQNRPQVSWWGISLAIAAAINMPLVWQGKLRIAKRIESASLKGDAVCSVTCAYMSFTLLICLLLNTFFGFWWADALAALALVYFIVRDGREALHEARTGEVCNCGDECA